MCYIIQKVLHMYIYIIFFLKFAIAKRESEKSPSVYVEGGAGVDTLQSFLHSLLWILATYTHVSSVFFKLLRPGFESCSWSYGIQCLSHHVTVDPGPTYLNLRERCLWSSALHHLYDYTWWPFLENNSHSIYLKVGNR